MSEEFATSVAEYEQELGIRPGILCAYDVEAGPIVDLTDPRALQAAGAERRDLTCPWKQIVLLERRRPSTWGLADRLIARGIVGVRVSSVRANGANVVIWTWNAGPNSPDVVALDPLGDLPLDQRSWQAP